MFCPNCGEKENNPVQFCRACGANLGVVRNSLEESDNYTASAINAREEIARAAAERIKTGTWWHVGAIVPEVEKLFESPQERTLRQQRQSEEQRLSRLRGGTITAAVGLGLILLFLIFAGTLHPNFLFLIGPSLLVFLIGLGVVVNGLYFTIPKALKTAGPNVDPADKIARELNEKADPKALSLPSETPFQHLSVVENTTRNLVESEKRDTHKIRQKRFGDE